jgi:DNA mismatch repair protein MutS
VTDRAKQILRNLEGSELTVGGEVRQKERSRIGAGEVQMTMFEMKDDALHGELKKIDIETMTPLEALQKLAELKRKIQ